MTAKHASSDLQAILVDQAFDGEVFINESMARHTSYRIGGPAKYYVRANSIRTLTDVISACGKTETPYFICGRGTNLLVSDEGYDGVVITLGRDFRNSFTDRERGMIVSGAGVPLNQVVQEALRNSLSGMEFAVGTPGSLGGALFMNAGTADDWIGSRVRSISVLRRSGSMEKLMAEDIVWGYRKTSLQAGETILECELLLQQGDPFLIQGKMEGSLSRRKKTQPLGQPSCGSIFRNPEGAKAAELISELGLKGARVGGAQISTKHANFIVNLGDATAKDVLTLIHLARNKVFEAYGKEMATEVKFLGF